MAVLGAAGGTGLAACELGQTDGPEGNRLRLVGRKARNSPRRTAPSSD